MEKPPLKIGAYTITTETLTFDCGYVVRRNDKPNRGRCYPTMALAIHHARRLNRRYPQRRPTSCG